jgi:hypothetical protein
VGFAGAEWAKVLMDADNRVGLYGHSTDISTMV